MGELAGSAHFWAMRSCKYAKVPKAEQRQTKQLRIRNIAFIKDGKILKHNSPSLHLADCVLITFERQKNDRKANTLTQWRTADELLCPVKIWASLVRRMLSYKGTNKKFSSLPCKRQQQNHQCNRGDDCRFVPWWSSNYQRDQTRHPPIRDRNNIYLLRCSDCHVPFWSASFLYHVNRKLVEHSFPQIHPKASTGVLARDLLKNDSGSDVQTRPKPNRNKPDGERSWRLVFVADGMNWWRKHHHQKNGGGAKPINNWFQAQPLSRLFIGILRYLAHIVCTFLFLSLRGEFLQGRLLWQRILCF